MKAFQKESYFMAVNWRVVFYSCSFIVILFEITCMGYEYLEQVHLLFAHADFMIYVNAVSLQNCFGFHSLDN